MAKYRILLDASLETKLTQTELFDTVISALEKVSKGEIQFDTASVEMLDYKYKKIEDIIK